MSLDRTLKSHLNFKCSGCLRIQDTSPFFWSETRGESPCRLCSCTEKIPKYVKCDSCGGKLNIYECQCAKSFAEKAQSDHDTQKYTKNIYWGDGMTPRGTEFDFESFYKNKK